MTDSNHHTLLAVRTKKLTKGLVEKGVYVSILEPNTHQLEAMYRAATGKGYLEEEIPGTVFKVQSTAPTSQSHFENSHPRLSQLLAPLSEPGHYQEGRSGQMITRSFLEQLIQTKGAPKNSPRESLKKVEALTFCGVEDTSQRLKITPRPEWGEDKEQEFDLTFLYPAEIGRAWLYHLREQPEQLNQAFQTIAQTRPKLGDKLLEEVTIRPQLQQKKSFRSVKTLHLLEQLSSQTLTQIFKEASPELRSKLIRHMGNRTNTSVQQEQQSVPNSSRHR